MLSKSSNRVVLALAYLFFSFSAFSADLPPQAPKFSFSFKVQNVNEIVHMNMNYQVINSLGRTEHTYYQWNPSTGITTQLPLPKKFWTNKAVKTKDGTLFFGLMYDQRPEIFHTNMVILVMPNNKIVLQQITLERSFDSAQMVLSKDQSVLMVGGKNESGKRLIVMERFRYFNGKINIERLPNLPFGNDRYGYSLVALSDGRAMVLGGETSGWVGCHQCLNETYIFDLTTKKWVHGPNMLEQRDDATATLLPNGNVLVIGGWTPTKGGEWGTISATTEIWNAKSNKFVQGGNLVDGTTMHEVTWLAGHEGKQLLIAGGKSNSIQLYDVEQNSVRLIQVLNEFQSDYRSLRMPSSFIFNKQSYVWLNTGTSDAGTEGAWLLVSVTLPKNGEEPIEQVDIKQGLVLNLYGFRFYPGEANQPSYIVGGHPPDSQAELNVTRAIWPDGRMQIVPSAKTSNAYSFDRSELPPLNRPRMDFNSNDVIYKKLVDGRVIVAGGVVQTNKIALANENSMDPNGRDDYLDVGQFYPARRHEIYDPKNKQWYDSAPSIMAGEKATVLNDGRVVKIGKLEGTGRVMDCLHKPVNKKITCTQASIEMSNAKGTAWTNLTVASPPLVDLAYNEVRPFVVQDELFLAGKHIVEIDEEGRYSATDITQWLNPQTKNWETLWESKLHENSRYDIGRIIFRELANGKRVVLPVDGF